MAFEKQQMGNPKSIFFQKKETTNSFLEKWKKV